MNQLTPIMSDQKMVADGTKSGGFHLPPVLLQYWHTAMRRRWLMLGIMAGALILGVVATLLMAPLYTAKVQLQIDRTQKQVTKVEGLDAQNGAQDVEFYATQYALLQARPMAERVAAELNLYTSVPFLEAHGVDPDILKEKDPLKSEAEMKEIHRRRVVKILLANIAVVPIRQSKLVDITYRSRDASMSAAIANKWASAFIAMSMDRQFASTADARAFLENRLQTLRERLEESEKQVVFYGSRTGIVSLDQVRDSEGRTIANRTLTGTTLEQLAKALNEATADRIAAESRAKGSGENASEAITSGSLANLRQQRAEIAAAYAKASVQFEPGYPRVIELERQLQVLDSSIGRETSRISQVRQREYAEARTREDQLKEKVNALKDQLDVQNRANILYSNYQREADTNRQLYDALLQRYKEIGVAGSIGVNNIAIVEPAIRPDRPSSPRLTINIAIALLVGMLAAAVTVFALEQIDEGIREPGEVEALLGLPLLGITPEVENAVVDELHDPKSHFFDACFSIRSSLAFTTNHGFPKSLAIISTRPNEGKSSTALVLSIILGRTGKRVLLVDADLRSPSIHAMVGLKNEHGFSNYLAGDDNWDNLTQETEFKNLSIVAAGPIPPSAAELLSGDRLNRFVADGLKAFDHIIIDSPPVLGMTDAPLIAKSVEGVVYIVQSAGAAVRGIRASIDRLRLVNAHLFGAVLTKMEEKSRGYGYGYGYGYGFGTHYGDHKKQD